MTNEINEEIFQAARLKVFHGGYEDMPEESFRFGIQAYMDAWLAKLISAPDAEQLTYDIANEIAGCKHLDSSYEVAKAITHLILPLLAAKDAEIERLNIARDDLHAVNVEHIELWRECRDLLVFHDGSAEERLELIQKALTPLEANSITAAKAEASATGDRKEGL